jgi:putative hemolysin
MSPGLALIAILICLLIEGFFSGSEMAMVSASRLELRAKADAGHRGAILVLELMERPERVLGTCLIGTNLCVVSAATIATALATSQDFSEPALIASLCLSPLVLILAEMVPKTIYEHHADLLAPVVARPLSWAAMVFTPGLVVVAALDRVMMRIARESDASPAEGGVSREELRMLMDSEKQGSIDEDEREMIRKVLEFSDISVREAMVPLIEVKALPESSTVREAAQHMVVTGLSRLPVYDKRVDNITGVVVHRDLLFAEDLDAPISSVQRKAPYVPETKSLEGLFAELRASRQRFAVVVDEYGGATGIITSEDILEEIVGEIEDEFDRGSVNIQRVDDRVWICDGRAELEHLEEAMDLALPEGDYETVAGFILARLGQIPAVGERVVYAGWRLTVSKATDRVIREVTLTRLEPSRKA